MLHEPLVVYDAGGSGAGANPCFEATRVVLQEGVAEGVAPGMVAGFWSARDPGRIGLIAAGQRRLLPSPQPMLLDTEFDLASLTKVMGTASLAAALVERGWLDWETHVSAILPEFKHIDVRIRHLLSHSSGLVWWKPFWEELRQEFAPVPLYQVSLTVRREAMRRRLMSLPLEAPVGSQVVYSDPSFLILGYALEEVAGMRLDAAIQAWVWGPMGVRARFVQTDRDAQSGAREHVAATELCPWRGLLQGQVHDDNAWAMGGIAPHAGSFARAQDVVKFGAQWLCGFVSERVRAQAWSRVADGRTLGWDTPSGPESSAGRLFGPGTVGHLGFTGTSIWIDPSAGVVVALLTNRVHPSRDNILIRAFRPRFHDVIREELARKLG